jgi:hypothetical protein
MLGTAEQTLLIGGNDVEVVYFPIKVTATAGPLPSHRWATASA